jgi:hypothetical protein
VLWHDGSSGAAPGADFAKAGLGGSAAQALSDGRVALLGCLDRLTSAHAVAPEFDPMSVMNDTVKNGVRNCWIAEHGKVPLFLNG